MIIFIWYVVISFPAWFFTHLSAAWLKLDIRGGGGGGAGGGGGGRGRGGRRNCGLAAVACGWCAASARACEFHVHEYIQSLRCSSYGECARRGFSRLGSSFMTEQMSGSVTQEMLHPTDVVADDQTVWLRAFLQSIQHPFPLEDDHWYISPRFSPATAL